MAFHVVDTQGRDVPGKCQGLCARGAHQQGPHQSRTCSKGNAVDLGHGTIGLCQDLANQRQHTFDVIARRKLGHDPAEDPVLVYLAEQCIGEKPALTVVQRNAGLIAGSFQSQY
jgi:hypothetical protein